jgi:NDP-sugar pyrophosphorylase family protein
VKAVVLVGGLGTRLRPLTYHAPKQMLPVVNKPMIEWAIANVAAHGVDEVVLSLGYGADAFVEAYPDGVCAGVALHFAVEDEPLDTAGAIRFAALDAGFDERFLVLNSDVITDLDVSKLLAFHDAHEAEGTIALHEVDDPSRYGVVPTDADDRVVAFVEKPPAGEAPTNRINAGTYVLEPSVLDRIPDGRRVSIERETFPALVSDGTLYAMNDGGAYWIDTGTPEAYLGVQLDIVDGRYHGSGSPGSAAVDPDAAIAGSATVSRAVIGPDVEIGDRADVSGSVIMRGTRVGDGARVRDSILGPQVVIGAGATVDALSVLGAGTIVGAGEVLHAERLPKDDA